MCPIVVQYWADLQSVYGFRCYDNIHVCNLIALYTAIAYSAEREMSASACTRCEAGFKTVHMQTVRRPPHRNHVGAALLSQLQDKHDVN